MTPKHHLKGFASMSKERRREIASKGGASVPAENRAFVVDNALAVRAASKGGSASRRPKKNLTPDG